MFNNRDNIGAGEYQQQRQDGGGELSGRESGNGAKYGARPKVLNLTHFVLV